MYGYLDGLCVMWNRIPIQNLLWLILAFPYLWNKVWFNLKGWGPRCLITRFSCYIQTILCTEIMRDDLSAKKQLNQKSHVEVGFTQLCALSVSSWLGNYRIWKMLYLSKRISGRRPFSFFTTQLMASPHNSSFECTCILMGYNIAISFAFQIVQVVRFMGRVQMGKLLNHDSFCHPKIPAIIFLNVMPYVLRRTE